MKKRENYTITWLFSLCHFSNYSTKMKMKIKNKLNSMGNRERKGKQ